MVASLISIVGIVALFAMIFRRVALFKQTGNRGPMFQLYARRSWKRRGRTEGPRLYNRPSRRQRPPTKRPGGMAVSMAVQRKWGDAENVMKYGGWKMSKRLLELQGHTPAIITAGTQTL